MSAFYADDFNREFHLGLMVGGLPGSPAIWSPDRWPHWISTLEPLVNSARAAAGIEGCFNQRWHGSFHVRNLVNYSGKQWRDPPQGNGVFMNWKLLGPSNRACARECRCPDVYACVSNLWMLPQLVVTAQTSVVIAIGADVANANDLLNAAMQAIGPSIPAKLIAKTRRPWGLATSTGYNNGISETHWLRSEMLTSEVDGQILAENWAHVDVALPP